MSAVKGRIFRSGTSRGAHIRALHAALLELEELLPADGAGAQRRIRIRTQRALLVRAYPELLKVNEVDLAWDLEEDTEVSDGP